MSKRTRQYIGILAAVLTYYIIHEGAHLIYALSIGVFKQINYLGMGIQIDVYHAQMADMQMGIFCLVGTLATWLCAAGLVLLRKQIGKSSSKIFKAVMYYITIVMLLLDPLYLSILCGFFGGGDMNGIKLLMPETVARIGFGVLLIMNILVFWRIVLPSYTEAFPKEN